MILSWILKSWGEAWIGLIWLRLGKRGGSQDCGNEKFDNRSTAQKLNNS